MCKRSCLSAYASVFRNGHRRRRVFFLSFIPHRIVFIKSQFFSQYVLQSLSSCFFFSFLYLTHLSLQSFCPSLTHCFFFLSFLYKFHFHCVESVCV
uniref:Uncharacterized protein n=1 Tax=Octopus bimaculoides TaxID=37653 RepID=A0A0L8G3R8_OCTBM